MDAEIIASVIGDSALIAFAVWRLTKMDNLLDRILFDESDYPDADADTT